MIKRLLKWFRGAGPQSLAMLARLKRKPSSSRLYVITVDFEMKAAIAEQLEKSLDPIRKKYGLDFIVLEPGMRLRRFDDF